MTHLLETKNLAIKIADKTICRQLNLAVRPGDVWGILGPNGCGKTTLLHTLAGLLSAEQGEIHYSGQQFLSAKKRAQHVGMLLQETQFVFPQSVFEYCLQGRFAHQDFFAFDNDNDKEITRKALSAMHLTNFSERNILTLSGGERRRLLIATLLTQSPQVNLLDEPINHLDPFYQVLILNHFKKLSQQQSAGVMMSLHDVNFAAHYCNKILLMFADGELLQGTPADVINSNNLSRLYKHSVQSCKNVWLPVMA